MDLIKQWLVKKILGYRRWSLRRRVMIMQLTLMREGNWIVTFDLCHIILSMIPLDLIRMVDRKEEEDAVVSLGTTDIDMILNYLDEIHNFIEYELSAANGNKSNKPRPLINTRKYSDEITDYSFGRLLSSTEKRHNAASLLTELKKRIVKITDTEYKDRLPDTTLSYLERMSNVIAAEVFELSTVLMGLVLHEQQIKTAKERLS